MLKKAAISLIACICVIGSASDIAFDLRPRLLYNPSPSAPIGWYRVMQIPAYKKGDLIAVFAPDDARVLAANRNYLPFNYPLIKTIWAGPGATVCRSETGIVSAPNRPVITALGQDSLGRDMPVWSGCVTLEKDQFFIASPDHQYGWDSRYFGPVRSGNILGLVHYLGDHQADRKSGSLEKKG